MQIREFSKPLTSKQLNEGLAQKFGYKINLEQFSDVQLEDARNKLRTKISQFEMNESYDSVLESPEYQKTRMFLDCINQAILEREQRVEEGTCEDCGESPCVCDTEEDDEKVKTESKRYISFIGNRAKKLSVPESWINSAIKRIELGESDNDELKAELKLRYDLNESQASWLLCEGEEDKAEIIMATKDMVDRITGWLEDVAAMKAEQLLELVDSIGKQQGSNVAQQYNDAVKPALEAIYTALETSRQGLSGALAIVSGGEAPTMGAPAGGEFAPGAAGGMTPPVPSEEELPALPGAEETTPPAPEALTQQALLLVVLGSIGILLWMTYRFRNLRFGMAALAALLHDVIVTVGFFAIAGTVAGIEIDALFVTAMLTIIGFSVHDTIVVFDRIRENLVRHAGAPFGDIVNHSIVQTLGRSFNTTATVLITLLTLLVFAGGSIRTFVLTLFVGILSGTYSSIFNASPLLVWWEERAQARKAAAARTRSA